MSEFLRDYEEFPPLEDLDPGIEPGWKYDVLILQAKPKEKSKGGIMLPQQTKDDEQLAAVEALLVAMAPNAFTDPDRPEDADFPYSVGDRVLTKKFPAGLHIKGRDGRDYMICKDHEIIGRRLSEVRLTANRIRDLPEGFPPLDAKIHDYRSIEEPAPSSDG